MARLPVISALDCDYDPELPTYDESKLDARRRVTENTTVPGWLHHFLGGFCAKSPKVAASAAPEKPTEPTKHKVHINSSWILPVSVLSVERDADRHQVPKEGQCTIDTSNMQGNIASRAFVVNVLGYLESGFDKLTKAEEGHEFIGAIHLTWYHKSSTRVFRDMRFLISEHPMYDLIIGARSTQEQNILDVPNLMVAAVGPGANFLKEKDGEVELVERMIQPIAAKIRTAGLKKKKEDTQKLTEEKKELDDRLEEAKGIKEDFIQLENGKGQKKEAEVHERARKYKEKYWIVDQQNEGEKKTQ